MTLEYIRKFFPFEEFMFNSPLCMDFGYYIAPLISIIFVVILFFMMIKKSIKPLSIKIFLIASGAAVLVPVFDIFCGKLKFYNLALLLWYLVAPSLLIICFICTIVFCFQVARGPHKKGDILMALFAFMASIFYYVFLITFGIMLTI